MSLGAAAPHSSNLLLIEELQIEFFYSLPQDGFLLDQLPESSIPDGFFGDPVGWTLFRPLRRNGQLRY